MTLENNETTENTESESQNSNTPTQSRTLYIGNLPYHVKAEHLQELFSKIGPVVSSRIISDRISGRSRGFGFVEMELPSDAEKAVDMYNGGEVDGRELRVRIADNPPQNGA